MFNRTNVGKKKITEVAALDLEQRCLESLLRSENSLYLPKASQFKAQFTFKNSLILKTH